MDEGVGMGELDCGAQGHEFKPIEHLWDELQLDRGPKSYSLL